MIFRYIESLKIDSQTFTLITLVNPKGKTYKLFNFKSSIVMIIKITKIKTGIRVKLTKVYHGIESFSETQYEIQSNLLIRTNFALKKNRSI